MPSNCCITIGIPSSGRPVAPEWALSMMLQAYPSNTSIGMMMVVGMEVGDARNKLVETALETNSEFIWFVDDDTAPPHYAAAKLIYEMRHRPECMAIGGVYCMKQDPPDPTVYRGNGHGSFWDWKVGEVFEVTAIGTGCLLVRTSVFRTIEQPWFKTTLSVPYELIEGERITSEGMSDDLYFCDKLERAGHKIFAHGGVLCDHWNAAQRLRYSLPPDSLPYQNLAMAA